MTSSKKDLVLYHDHCMDGFTAAWAAFRKLGPGADYEAVSYNEPPPNVTSYKNVYIVDFSYPPEILVEMANTVSGEVVVLDHHKTARESLCGLMSSDQEPTNLRITFDMDKSGAMLSWEYFHTKPAPNLVKYVQDRDLWSWRLPDSKAVSAVIQTTPFEFSSWEGLDEKLSDEVFFKELVSNGTAILSFVDQHVNRYSKNPGFTYIGEHLVPCVNDGTWQSEIGNRLSRKYPFAVVWFQNNNGDFVYSLRSASENPDNVDVSAIAKQYGGGGHRHAAGFKSQTAPVLL